MKKLTLFSLFAFFGLIAFAQDQKIFEEPADGPKIEFTEVSFDFGDITQGDVVEHVFEFKNTGTQPLILSNVRTTCGCTAPSWPREPIPPGESSKMTVKFNSRGKVGMQNKVVTIYSNSVEKINRIKIEANVKMPQSEG